MYATAAELDRVKINIKKDSVYSKIRQDEERAELEASEARKLQVLYVIYSVLYYMYCTVYCTICIVQYCNEL